MAQHAFGSELVWWERHGIDPFALCIEYYARYGGDGGKPYRKPKRDPIKQAMADAIRERAKMHKRLQRAKRHKGNPVIGFKPSSRTLRALGAKIPSRPFPKQQRGLRG